MIDVISKNPYLSGISISVIFHIALILSLSYAIKAGFGASLFGKGAGYRSSEQIFAVSFENEIPGTDQSTTIFTDSRNEFLVETKEKILEESVKEISVKNEVKPVKSKTTGKSLKNSFNKSGDGTFGEGDPGNIFGVPGFTPPSLISSDAPKYPRSAKSSGVGGEVVILAKISNDGEVSAVDIQKSSGAKSLDEAATQTVLNQFKFSPAKYLGQPVTSEKEIKVLFKLNS